MTGREEELAEVARWAEGIEQVHSCIAGRFRRPEPRRRVLDYLRGLVSSVERKNGWQLAEQAGDATPDGVQRLLSTYRWDADLVRDDMRDPTWWSICPPPTGCWWWTRPDSSRKGSKSVGSAAAVQRDGGADRELSDWRFSGLCQRQGQNPAGPGIVPAPGVGGRLGAAAGGWGAGRCVGFRTKPQLAQLDAGSGRWNQESPSAGLPALYTGDEVYGNDRKPAAVAGAERECPHVLAIRSNEKLWVWTDQGLCQVRADRLTLRWLTQLGWHQMQCGRWGQGAHGSTIGPVVEIRPLEGTGQGLLAAGPAQHCQARGVGLLTYASASAGTALEELVRVAGDPVGHRGVLSRRPRGRWGLDQYEVWRWDDWYRHITLAMLAQAYLSVAQASSGPWGPGRKGGCLDGPDEELIPITVPRGAPAAHPTGMDGKSTARWISSCPGRGGDGATKPEPSQCHYQTPPQTSGIKSATVVLRPAACSAAAAGEAETPTPIRFGLSCGLRLAGWLEPRLHERLTAVLLLKSTFFTMVRTTTAASFAGSPCRCPRC